MSDVDVRGPTSVWAQFFSTSAIVAAAGLGLQTLLAIYLLVRWRLHSNP